MDKIGSKVEGVLHKDKGNKGNDDTYGSNDNSSY